jgi:hypothetical protein
MSEAIITPFYRAVVANYKPFKILPAEMKSIVRRFTVRDILALSALKLASSPGGRKRLWLPRQFRPPPEIRVVIEGIHSTSHRRTVD